MLTLTCTQLQSVDNWSLTGVRETIDGTFCVAVLCIYDAIIVQSASCHSIHFIVLRLVCTSDVKRAQIFEAEDNFPSP